MTRAELKVVGTLVVAHARHRPARIVLTLLSMIMAACIVVWVVSGYDSLLGQFKGFSEDYLGRYDLILLPAHVEGSAVMFGRTDRPLANGLVEAVRRDPTVAVVDATFETNLPVIRRAGGDPGKTKKSNERSSSPSWRAERIDGTSQAKNQALAPALVGTDSSEPIQTVVNGRWFDPSRSERREGVITSQSAEALGLKVGDQVTVVSPRMVRENRVTIVGISSQPKRLLQPSFIGGLPPSRNAALLGGPAGHALYVPTTLAAVLLDTKATTTYAGVTLKGGTRADEFVARWNEQFAKASPAVEARTVEKIEADVDRSTTFESIRVQAFSAVSISLLAALFIVFTTLSMGVHERIRQFAMLRAITLTRAQVGAMILLESFLLGLIGWLGGLLAGWVLLATLARLHPEILGDGASLGSWCVALSGLCAFGGALAASVLPAWRAMSVQPLDAMAPLANAGMPRVSWSRIVLGLVLVAVNPFVVFVMPVPDAARYGVSAVIGCTSMAIGFALLAAPTVMLTESLLGPLLARVMWLNPQFLAMQLSSNLWRSVGTTISLSLGLGLFVAMQTWGYSMLGPFIPGTWSPDLVISIAPLGVPDSEIGSVRSVKGIAASRFVPLALKQVKFAEDLTGARIRATATRQENCVMVGVDPDTAFGGDAPVFDFTFVEGTREGALAKLKQGRYCLVPDHFTLESGLGVGDKIPLIPRQNPQNVVTYEIAGVVSMPGWHWMTKVGFRRGRAAALMISPAEHVKRDFDTGWTEVDPNVQTTRPGI